LELLELLSASNGFVTFESALVVFPSDDAQGVPGLARWNAPAGWRRHYEDVLSPEHICFAHDLFGLQFATSPAGVVKFNPATGGVTPYAASISGWAERLLANFNEDTSWRIAEQWQIAHRSLLPNERLLPKRPFVPNAYAIANLIPMGGESAMEKWGKWHRTIRDLREGETIYLSEWTLED
jgi:hypothetical protein